MIKNSLTAVAAALPALATDGGLYLGNNASTSNYTRIDSVAGTMPNGIALPSGDWTLGLYINIPTATDATSSQVILGAGTGTNPYSSASTFSIQYRADTGIFRVHGLDGSSNPLGQRSPYLPAANTLSNTLAATHPLWPNDNNGAWLFVVKTGSQAQLWLAFDGHAPVLSDDSFTSFGALAVSFWIGLGRDSSNRTRSRIKRFFKVSYALTKDQMNQVQNGVVPTTLGTPASDDYNYALAADASSYTSTINGCTMTRTFDFCDTANNLGWAAQTEAVFLDPPGPDGYVIQHINGSATLNLAGTYQGADGGNIQIQFLDFNNIAFQGWQTIATTISGKTWSGSVSVPKGQRWIKAQLRKVISGTPSTDVMTTSIRWGVGEVVFLSGQSLMENLSNTTNPAGGSTIDPNGFVSEQINIAAQITIADRLQFAVTGAANNGSGAIRITCSGRHGLRFNEEVMIRGVVGTTEANGRWPVTPISATTFDLQGSTFTNAYVSGGRVYPWNNSYRVMNRTRYATADGITVMGNAISQLSGAVVSISNQAVGGQAIDRFNTLDGASGVNNYANTTILAARRAGRVGTFLWQHGHANIGQTSYFMDSGTWGSEVGFGALGTLHALMAAQLPNSDFGFGLVGFISVGGNTATTAANVHNFRRSFATWPTRFGGNAFYVADVADMQPRWENSVSQNAHPSIVQNRKLSARIGQGTAARLTGSGSALGPRITSAVRSGATVDLTLTHNGGTDIRWARSGDGAIPSGFEVATDTGFTSKLAISNITRINGTTLRITLASDPGATVHVRYLYGMVGDYTSSTDMTLRVTGVADNGSGLIRVTMANPVTPATPSGSQRDLLLTDVDVGRWIQVLNVAGSTQANGVWQIAAKGTDWIDLAGSSSAGLGAFTANSDLFNTNATGMVLLELAVPIYDDRTIGLTDTDGAPLQPTETFVTAT